jgi:hypothetical protein
VGMTTKEGGNDGKVNKYRHDKLRKISPSPRLAPETKYTLVFGDMFELEMVPLR